MSISLFPGAVNADLAGYADSFWRRSLSLLGTCCCFILSGGNLESLTEDIRREELHAAREFPNQVRSGSESTAQAAAQQQLRQNTGFSDESDSDEPEESAKVYHRAITSLYAGTDPKAGQLNGKVRTRIRHPELILT